MRMSGLRRVYIPKLLRTTLGDSEAVVVHVVVLRKEKTEVHEQRTN